MLFGGGDQTSPDSGALALRIDGQQPEVTAFAALFGVNATGQHSIFEQYEEFPFLKKLSDFVGVCTISGAEETFGAKGVVHQSRDCGRVS